MDQMAQRVSSCPISLRCAASRDRPASRSIRPSSAFKPGRSAPNSQDVSTQITTRTSDLDALTSGADQLAAASPRFATKSVAPRATTQLAATLNQVQQQLGRGGPTPRNHRGLRQHGPATTLVNNVVNSAAPMLDAMNNNPQCDADPTCSHGRAKLQQLIQASNDGSLNGLTQPRPYKACSRPCSA